MSFLITLAQAASTAATQAASNPATVTQTTENAKAWYEYGLIGWYYNGGFFMIPLFLCQVIGLAIIIERILAYRAISIDTSGFRAKIAALLSGGKVDDALVLCDTTPGPVSATIAVGLRRFKLLRVLGKPADQIESEVSKAVDDFGVHIIAILEKHLPLLATVTALAPLFGFIGTVYGMVEAFDAITQAAGSGNIILVTASGIKVALLTTVLGLCIAIPAQFFYNAFSNRVNGFVLEVEESATELVQNLALMSALGDSAITSSPADAKAVLATTTA